MFNEKIIEVQLDAAIAKCDWQLVEELQKKLGKCYNVSSDCESLETMAEAEFQNEED